MEPPGDVPTEAPLGGASTNERRRPNSASFALSALAAPGGAGFVGFARESLSGFDFSAGVTSSSQP